MNGSVTGTNEPATPPRPSTTGPARRVAVVGASSGLGRSIALGLSARGDHVALLARRRDRLDRAVDQASGHAIAIECDVTDEVHCAAAIAAAATELGGLDALVYSSGVIAIEPLAATSAATWTRLFATNVVGAATATRAALPHLRATHGRAIYLSSVSAQSGVWPLLGAYTATKAALDKMIDTWRDEHPELGFTRLIVGDSAGGPGESATQLGADASVDLLLTGLDTWQRRGLRSHGLVDPDDLVSAVAYVLGSTASIPVIAVTPPPAPMHGAPSGG